MSRTYSGVLRRVAHGRSAEAGAVALIVALLMPVFIGFVALSVDVARWYVEAERLQKAADAASLAGVVYMPQEFDQAQQVALDTARRNGYAPSATVSIEVTPGPRPSQLRVEISSTIENAFAAAIGFSTSTITRSSVADYNGPAPMGSPCSTFGNEPEGSPGAGPLTALPTIPVNPFCTTYPAFWANIQGPETDKIQGDRYMNRRCSAGVDGCTGSANDDFRPEGYFFVIRVTDPARTGSVTVQLYDPAWIYTQVDCGALPDSLPSNNMNTYATTDARTRYDDTNNRFCTGDYAPGRSDNGVRVDTSFVLRAPVDTQNPLDSSPISGCTAQYKGSTSVPTASQLQQYRVAGNSNSGTNTSYLPELAKIFHQWVPLCTVPTPVAGDYYLQVRTNVAMPSTGPTQFIATGNTAVAAQSGDNTSVRGSGSNQFAIRAVSADGSAVSVAGYERMPIDINATNPTTTFNLIRVLPGAAGKYVRFSFYDAADGSSGGTVQVQRPQDATGSITATSALQGCQGSGVRTGTLAGCSVTVTPQANNGKIQTISVPIPADYNCDYNRPGGCWYRVVVHYSQATDITTWTATVEGDPVRIVK